MVGGRGAEVAIRAFNFVRRDDVTQPHPLSRAAVACRRLPQGPHVLREVGLAPPIPPL